MNTIVLIALLAIFVLELRWICRMRIDGAHPRPFVVTRGNLPEKPKGEEATKRSKF